MKVEVITVGDEIISGNIVDTNFAWLGEKIWTAGFELHWHTSVGDEPESIQQSVLDAAKRSQAVIVTGGLGPTIDDITVEEASRAFGLSLVMNQEALQVIRDRFQKIGREMSPNNEKQALFPVGSFVIPNPQGTAPGCYVVFQNTHFFFLPGVPQEMKRQFDDFVMPKLLSVDSEKKVFSQKVLRCFGLPESAIGKRLDDIDLSGVDLAYRISFPEILLKISARGPKKEDLEKRLLEVETEIKKRLGVVVYGEGETSLSAVLGELLQNNNATVSVAESCTGGTLASLLTDTPGSSKYFDRGFVTYSNLSKMENLGVPESVIQNFGAVSSETAMAMANGLRKMARTTYSLAVTGIAGPAGGTPEKPVGTVHIALDSEKSCEDHELHFPTTREWFKKLVAYAAMDLLRKKLLKK